MYTKIKLNVSKFKIKLNIDVIEVLDKYKKSSPRASFFYYYTFITKYCEHL